MRVYTPCLCPPKSRPLQHRFYLSSGFGAVSVALPPRLTVWREGMEGSLSRSLLVDASGAVSAGVGSEKLVAMGECAALLLPPLCVCCAMTFL